MKDRLRPLIQKLIKPARPYLLRLALSLIELRYRGHPITIYREYDEGEPEDEFVGYLESVKPTADKIILTLVPGFAAIEMMQYRQVEHVDFRSVRWNMKKRRFEAPKSVRPAATPSSGSKPATSSRTLSSALSMVKDSKAHGTKS
jgi:hypothetical protein